jgi:prepilin-type N-terminal cleavage/methylation domain-containing protein
VEKKIGGFTLAELLTVVAVLALLTGMAMPLVRGFEGRALKTSAQELAVHMREARTTAITGGKSCMVVFYEWDHRYRLIYPEERFFVILPAGIRYGGVNFPNVDGRSTLYFRYTGAPNAGGHVTLRDSSGRRLYVIVTPVTGRVRISDSPP